MSQGNFVLNNEEKIALLEELHRPLEEHWSLKTKFGLDPKSSEYIYKHHVTRLQDIYATRRHEPPAPPGLLYMSPVSQLYGVHGLNVVHDETRLKRKEEKWVSNFPKYTCLSDGTLDVDGKKGPPPRGRSNSPPRQRTREVVSAADRRSRKKEDAIAAHSKPLRSACYDPNIAPEDVVMLGMYRLDERQQEIYRNFVDMLAEFDEYDRGNILEDALRDAQGEEDLLEGYGGTSLATAPAIASLQGAPAATAAGAAAGASSAGARPGSAPAKARSHSPGAHPLHPPHSATGTQQAAGTHRPGTSDPAFVGRN